MRVVSVLVAFALVASISILTSSVKPFFASAEEGADDVAVQELATSAEDAVVSSEEAVAQEEKTTEATEEKAIDTNKEAVQETGKATAVEESANSKDAELSNIAPVSNVAIKNAGNTNLYYKLDDTTLHITRMAAEGYDQTTYVACGAANYFVHFIAD